MKSPSYELVLASEVRRRRQGDRAEGAATSNSSLSTVGNGTLATVNGPTVPQISAGASQLVESEGSWGVEDSESQAGEVTGDGEMLFKRPSASAQSELEHEADEELVVTHSGARVVSATIGGYLGWQRTEARTGS